jgi:hypothetical protein
MDGWMDAILLGVMIGGLIDMKYLPYITPLSLPHRLEIKVIFVLVWEDPFSTLWKSTKSSSSL